jgi:mannose-6-phosphate isomerase-like protein (cupin superfamily)
MDEARIEIKRGVNYTAAHLRGWERLEGFSFQLPGMKDRYPGKLFMKEPLGLTGLEMSLNRLPPGGEIPFLHRHRENEELYIFIKGRGRFQVDGEVLEVGEGSVIRVAPDGVRAWRNDSDEDLYFIVIQVRADSMPDAYIADGESVPGKAEWE